MNYVLPRDRRTASFIKAWLLNGKPLPAQLEWIARNGQQIKHDCLMAVRPLTEGAASR